MYFTRWSIQPGKIVLRTGQFSQFKQEGDWVCFVKFLLGHSCLHWSTLKAPLQASLKLHTPSMPLFIIQGLLPWTQINSIHLLSYFLCYRLWGPFFLLEKYYICLFRWRVCNPLHTQVEDSHRSKLQIQSIKGLRYNNHPCHFYSGVHSPIIPIRSARQYTVPSSQSGIVSIQAFLTKTIL